jgi:Flp pilus assembly pilin Flp
LFRDGDRRDAWVVNRSKEESMIHAVATVHARLLGLAARIGRDERGQGTVEYVGLAMAVGVLLLAVSSFLGGQDHGIGSIITSAIKSAVQRAAGGGK